MRITISSPDGLGDFILRVPMLQALREAGHELQVLLRRPAWDLARAVFPDALCLEIAADPYHPEIRSQVNPFRAEQAAVRKFAPDLYVASLFALNFFDEVWLENDRLGVPVAGFEAEGGWWPSGTIADPRTLSGDFRIRVRVGAEVPELEKNRLLASAILGNTVPAVPPRLVAESGAIKEAEVLLRAHGLAGEAFRAVCIGTRSGLQMKDWGEGNWARFLRETDDGQTLVFFGNTKEWESVERIIAACGRRCVNLAGAPPSLPVSLALTSLSTGYIGRDSGVMHMACAAGKPILAAYGGGHWGRFLPSSGPAVAVTQAMSCRQCDFACPHEQAHCVAGIRMETMVSAWRRLADATGVEVIEQSSDEVTDNIPRDEARAYAMARWQEARERARTARQAPPANRTTNPFVKIHMLFKQTTIDWARLGVAWRNFRSSAAREVTDNVLRPLVPEALRAKARDASRKQAEAKGAVARPAIYVSYATDENLKGSHLYCGGEKLLNNLVLLLRRHGYDAFMVSLDGRHSGWLAEHAPFLSVEGFIEHRHHAASSRCVTSWVKARAFLDHCPKFYLWDQELGASARSHFPELARQMAGGRIVRTAGVNRVVQTWHSAVFSRETQILRQLVDERHWQPNPSRRQRSRVGYFDEGSHGAEYVRAIREITRRAGLDLEFHELRGVETEVIAQMQTCSVFLTLNIGKSPWGEGGPMTPQEAMACGTVPVCFDLKGAWELIQQNYNGVITHEIRPELMAEAVVGIYRETGRLEEMSRRCLEITRASHTMESRWPDVTKFLDLPE